VRLFVSVEPPADARAALAEALDRRDIGPARLVSPERWHITLAFLGEVYHDRVLVLGSRLAEVAARAAPLQLGLAGAGVFPSRGRPSVLWVGLTGDIEPLRELAGTVASSLRQAGVRLERRRFAPHLTVARYRNAAAGASATKAAVAVAELSGHSGPRFTVEEIRLMRSHLGRHPWHEPVGAWRLAGQRGSGEP